MSPSSNDICSRLDALEYSSEDPDENWTVFRKKSRDSLERNTENHRHTSVMSTQDLVQTAYSNICKTVQTRLTDMQVPG